MNVANGQQSTAIGGFSNYALGMASTSIGGYGKDYATGYDSSVNGSYSVAIAGGSTGKDAANSLAAGQQAVVTTENGTAIGYQATTDEANTIAFGHDKGDVSGYTVEWEKLPDGQTNADGTTNDYTKAPKSVTATTYDKAAYNRLVKVAEGVEDHDVVVMKQLKDYTKTNASNIGKNLNYKADGTAVTDEDKKTNEKAWGEALGTGDINTPSGMLVTDTALHNELRPANGTYVKAANTTAQNLTALDTQAGTNTIDIAGLKNLSNITDAGKSVIKELSKGAVKVVKGTNTTVTEGTDGDAKTYAVNVDDSAIKGAVQGDLDKKANVDATNIQGENLTNWQAALGTGAVTSGNTGLMTGGAVYNEVRPTKDGTYVKSTNTTATNLTALDTQVTTNTGDITTNKTDIKNLKDLSNLTDAGKTVIKNAAKGAVKVVNGKNTTVTEGTEGDAKTYAVNVDNSAIKGAVQGDLDKKANVDATNIQGENLTKWQAALGTGAVTSGNTGLMTGGAVYNEVRPTTDGTYVKSTSTTAANLTSLDTQVTTNTGDIATNKTDIKNLKDLSNLTDTGKTVIKNAAKGAVKVINGKNTTVSEGSEGDAKTYAVNVDDSAIKGAVQGDLNKKADVDATNIQGENLTKWQAALGTGAVTSGNTGLMPGGAVYNEVRPTTDGTYVKSTNTTATNLTALDTQVTTNTSDIAKNKTDIANNKTAIDNITKNISDLSGNAVQYDADSNKQKVTLKGDGGTTIANVKDGAVAEGSMDAVNGDQLFDEQKARQEADNAINQKIGSLDKDGSYIHKDSSISDNLSNLDDQVGKNTKAIDDLQKSSSDISGKLGSKADKDLGNLGDEGKQVIKDTMKDDMDKKANVDASNIDTSKWAEKLGTGNVAEGDKNLVNGDTVHNAIREAEGRNPVQSNGQTITIGSKDTATKIDVSGTGKDGQSTGRIITGVVTDANDPNSAANVGYVNGLTAANTQQIYRDMNNAYSRLDTNINRAAAGSNALAALHPLDFDPADKASFAVGFGHYHNANAAAVGAFYYPNANTMVNVGVSVGNGDPGFNAGVSFKIGKGSTYNGVSKAEMAQTIHDQAAEISTIKANDAAKDKRIDALEKENQEMKKQIQEILARLNG